MTLRPTPLAIIARRNILREDLAAAETLAPEYRGRYETETVDTLRAALAALEEEWGW